MRTRKPKPETAPAPVAADPTHAMPDPVHAIVGGAEAVVTGGPDQWDNRTHIERINPGDNPAAIPGQGIVHVAGEAASDKPTAKKPRRSKRA